MLALGLLQPKRIVFQVSQQASYMWMEKLLDGVLRVRTPLGPRYVRPSFWQRMYLLWIFRNFQVLPVKVLSVRQQRRIEDMCTTHGFLTVLGPDALADSPILGTLEQRPPVELGRARRAVSDSVTPFAADQQQP